MSLQVQALLANLRVAAADLDAQQSAVDRLVKLLRGMPDAEVDPALAGRHLQDVELADMERNVQKYHAISLVVISQLPLLRQGLQQNILPAKSSQSWACCIDFLCCTGSSYCP